MVTAPIGKVRFRDFFFTDVVTSIGSSIADIGIICAYFTEGFWLTNEPVDKKEHPRVMIYVIVISFLPYWWRFW